MVDIGRYPFTEERAIFRNSDVKARIHWYPAAPTAKPCPFPTFILDEMWDIDEVDTNGNYNGPLPPPPKSNFAPVKPTALGLHVCGTAQDFAEGGYYDPTAPPVQYWANGLPKCCDPIFAGVGGAVGGGTGTVTWTPPVGPGPTCITALALANGVPYAGTKISGTDQWFSFHMTTGTSVRFRITWSVPALQPGILWYGSCPSLFAQQFWAGNLDVTYAVGALPITYYVQLYATGAGAYTIRVDAS